MNPNLIPIAAIAYIEASKITDYKPNPDGTVAVRTFEPLKRIKFAIGSLGFLVGTKVGRPGAIITTTLSCTLKEPIYADVNSYLILFLHFCDGTIRVLGSPHLPVALQHTHTDLHRAIALEHDSYSNPLILTNTDIFPQ